MSDQTLFYLAPAVSGFLSRRIVIHAVVRRAVEIGPGSMVALGIGAHALCGSGVPIDTMGRTDDPHRITCHECRLRMEREQRLIRLDESIHAGLLAESAMRERIELLERSEKKVRVAPSPISKAEVEELKDSLEALTAVSVEIEKKLDAIDTKAGQRLLDLEGRSRNDSAVIGKHGADLDAIRRELAALRIAGTPKSLST